MKKKFLTLLLCLSTLSILVACGSNDSNNNNNSPIENQVSEAASQNSLISDNYFNDKKITKKQFSNSPIYNKFLECFWEPKKIGFYTWQSTYLELKFMCEKIS